MSFSQTKTRDIVPDGSPLRSPLGKPFSPVNLLVTLPTSAISRRWTKFSKGENSKFLMNQLKFFTISKDFPFIRKK